MSKIGGEKQLAKKFSTRTNISYQCSFFNQAQLRYNVNNAHILRRNTAQYHCKFEFATAQE